MNTQQPVYLLAGGRGKTILTTFSYVRQIIKNIGKEKPEIAYVGAASMKDNWLIYAFIASLIKAGCNCRIKRVVIAAPKADLNRARETLQKADAVFVSGGDVEVGMQVLQEKNMVGYFQDLARQGKLFFGVSAGSIMLSREWVRWRDPEDDSTVELFTCLGTAPLVCDTHCEKDDWVELKTALKLKGEGATGYGITSGACLKYYPDGRTEAENGPVARYTLHSGKIVRLTDLLPEGPAG